MRVFGGGDLFVEIASKNNAIGVFECSIVTVLKEADVGAEVVNVGRAGRRDWLVVNAVQMSLLAGREVTQS